MLTTDDMGRGGGGVFNVDHCWDVCVGGGCSSMLTTDDMGGSPMMVSSFNPLADNLLERPASPGGPNHGIARYRPPRNAFRIHFYKTE